MKLNITNREQIIEQLTEMLIQFDKNANKYQTDVYLYYDAETQTAELDTFVNVGGNSWLDDDHYTIYSDKEHYEDVFNWYQNTAEIADALDISNTELEYEVREYHGLDADDEPDYGDFVEYVKKQDNYMEILTAAYYDAIEEIRPDYIEKAENIMDEFDEWCENIED